jgi:chromosome segregation ATPase
MEERKPKEKLEKGFKRCNGCQGACFEIKKIEEFYPGKSTCKACVSKENWEKRRLMKLSKENLKKNNKQHNNEDEDDDEDEYEDKKALMDENEELREKIEEIKNENTKKDKIIEDLISNKEELMEKYEEIKEMFNKINTALYQTLLFPSEIKTETETKTKTKGKK